MDQTLNVAFVRSNNRRGAVAEALALIADELRARVTPSVVLLPHPDSDADTLSATLDAVLHAGAIEIVAVESRVRATQLGHRRELFGRPVRFVDPAEPEANGLLTAVANVSCEIAIASVATRGQVRSADALLAALPQSRRAGGSDRPGILVVDAFALQHAVLAGTEASAVARVAASALGGAAELDAAGIRIVGDRPEPARRSLAVGWLRGPRGPLVRTRDRVA